MQGGIGDEGRDRGGSSRSLLASSLSRENPLGTSRVTGLYDHFDDLASSEPMLFTGGETNVSLSSVDAILSLHAVELALSFTPPLLDTGPLVGAREAMLERTVATVEEVSRVTARVEAVQRTWTNARVAAAHEGSRTARKRARALSQDMEALRGELIDVEVNRRELDVVATLAMVAAGVLRGIGATWRAVSSSAWRVLLTPVRVVRARF